MEKLKKLFDPRIVEKVLSLRLMDDELMARVFSDDLEATQFILRILMKNDSLKVLKSHSQNDLRNIFGRSVKLDILAEDSNHNLINVEIQRADKGAVPKRARYHASMLDTHFLAKGEDFENLKSTYVIFITEKDVWKKGLPIYEVEKSIKGTNLPFEDDLHILYVNGEYRGKDSLGNLMHDFCCPNPDEMKYEELAEKVRYYKQETEEVNSMCKAFEDLGKILAEERAAEIVAERVAERLAERNVEIAEKMIRKGTYSIEEISELSGLSKETVEQLAEEMKVGANVR